MDFETDEDDGAAQECASSLGETIDGLPARGAIRE